MSAKSAAKPTASTISPAKKPLPHWLPDVLGVLALYVLVIGLFHQVVLSNKVFSAGDDTEAAVAWNTFAIREAENGQYPLWCPDVFGGFPSFAAGAYSNYEYVEAPYALAYRWANPRWYADMFTNYVLLLGNYSGPTRGEKWLVALMLYAGLFVYFVIRRLGFAVPLAVLCGLVLAWNPYFISLVTASHGGKLATFIYIPILLYLAWQLYERRRLLDLALFAMVFGWQIQHGGHTQVLFYTGVSVGILFITWAIHELRSGGLTNVALAGGQLFAGVVLAIGVGSLWYFPLLEYVEYSIRGVGPAIGAATQSGYSLADATAWSMHPAELITFVFPSWYGLKSPTYWGDMMFTSSSFYFGIIPLALAIIALIGAKSRFVWGLVALSLFSILLSFGKHFESFYSVFFNYFPFFNKFRTPSLILLLVIFCGALLAAFGYRKLEEHQENEKWIKAFRYALVGAGVLLVISLVGGESLAKSLASLSKVGEAQRYQPGQITQLTNMRADMFATDLTTRLFMLALGLAAMLFFLMKKLTKPVLVGALLLLTAVDLGVFAHQFFEPQTATQQLTGLAPNRVVSALQDEAKKDVFRVFPVGRLNQDNRWAAWGVESWGGYHGAKLRSWQDMSDNLFYNGTNRNFPLNFELLASLNCKYILTEGLLPPDVGLQLAYEDGSAKMACYRLPIAKERAYFADSVMVVADRTQAFETMRRPGFPFTKLTVLDKGPPGAIGNTAQATARVTKHEAHRVEISTDNAQAGLLVLADAYYAPEWRATIDGQPTDIYLVNGFARGTYVAAGAHTVVYEYVAKREGLAVNVATASHFLVLLLVGVGYWMTRRRPEQVA
ncbi:MAG: hypothetical protein IPK53_14045 [bacterium]|nr:hypothetical protein [bacterium]